MSAGTFRLFLAVPLSHVFLQEIKGVLDPLKAKIPGIKWVDPEQVHVTLHFFGDVPASEIDRIDQAMRRILPDFSPMNVRLNGIGGFPDLKRPRVIWIGVEEDSGAFIGLQKAAQCEIRRLDFEVESRPFKPHATIGRVKKLYGPGSLPEEFKKMNFQFPTAPKVLDHFVLFQSRLLSGGAHYEALKTFPLSKAG